MAIHLQSPEGGGGERDALYPGLAARCPGYDSDPRLAHQSRLTSGSAAPRSANRLRRPARKSANLRSALTLHFRTGWPSASCSSFFCFSQLSPRPILLRHAPYCANTNTSGVIATVSTGGVIDPTNPFFRSVGSSGRSCASCHDPAEGWTITPAGARSRFEASEGHDPIFRSN